MTNIDLLLTQAAEALNAEEKQDAFEMMRAFIERWVPIVTNEITALRNEKNFLELELTEARNALED